MFLKTQYLEPLNTCKKHFKTILLNLPLDECKIQRNCTQWYILFDVATAIVTVVDSQKVTTNGDQFQ